MCSRCSERPKDGPHSCFSAHRIKIESKQRVGIFSRLLTFKAQFKAAVTFTDHTALNTGRATLGSEGGFKPSPVCNTVTVDFLWSPAKQRSSGFLLEHGQSFKQLV